jgi:hypothetical protein
MSNRPSRTPRTVRPRSSEADRYRWVALTNTTMAVLMSSLDELELERDLGVTQVVLAGVSTSLSSARPRSHR